MASPTSGTGTGTIWYADRDPTTSEADIVKGNFWLNETSYNLLICIDDTPDELQWLYV